MNKKMILFIFVGLFLMITIGCSPKEDSLQVDDKLSDSNISEMKEKLEELFKEDKRDGYEQYLDKIYVDKDTGTFRIRIDIQQDPLPLKKEMKEQTEAIAWFIGTQIEKGIKIQVTATTKLGEDEFILYGHAFGESGSEETRFEGERGIEILK